MSKTLIQKLVRENIFDRIKEAQPTGQNEPEEKEDEGHGKKDKKNTKKDYGDVQNYFNKELSFSQVDVMKKALGWEDDDTGTNRSLFGKMLHQEKNDEGGLYQFDNQQLDRIRTAIKLK